jgi:flagellar motor switch/type III secretory pathway protein FliN
MAHAATVPAGTAPGEEAWAQVLGLGCELTAELPLPGFRLADLARLQSGSIVASRSRVGSDIPLRVNGQLIGWCELEAVGSRLAIRITELA